MSRPNLGIALIGSGFMGRAHALAFRAADAVFDLPVVLVLEILADRDAHSAAFAAATLGFARSTGDWRQAVADPAIGLVAIAAPNDLHAIIAEAAIAAGKPVYCEKPLAISVAQGEAMVRAAEAGGIATGVGFTYLFNPMIALAREIVADGEIGAVTGFRGSHAEDFMADPAVPFGWRCAPDKAGGALADIGSHIIALAHHLVGDIAAVSGQLHTQHRRRMDADGISRAVTVDDQMDALVRFAGGAVGTLSASWIASGRKNWLAFELTGTKGAIRFDQERFNELQLYSGHDATGRRGFRTILAGPGHGDYAAFCPAAGHQLGYNDLKTIEVKAMLDRVAGRPAIIPDFRAALAVDRVADAIRRSAREGGWAGGSQESNYLS